MNYLKDNPVGVDEPIKRIQTSLYDRLTKLWDGKTIDGYGRVYKNKLKGDVIPEYYVSDKEYREVLLDDTKDCIFFFNVGDNVSVNGTALQVNCEVIFSVNVESIKNDLERQDEEVRNDAFLALNRSKRSFEINEIVKGLTNVYSDFPQTAEKFLDMQQFHHFKIIGTLNYNNNCI